MSVTEVPTTVPGLHRTLGEWADEPSSVAEFDRRINATGLFRVYSEVTGYYLQPRLDQDRKDPRLDRLLLPTPKMRALGWLYGAIGVECKASDVKVGPCLAQCMDYSRAAFVTPEYGVSVLCTWVFLWPFHDCGGDLWSIMTQNRIGAVSCWNEWGMTFHAGGGSLLNIYNDGNVRIGMNRAGAKAGSR
jgi:hypothetical protein